MTEWTKFDAALYLSDPAVVAEYLQACRQDENLVVFRSALLDVARADLRRLNAPQHGDSTT
jgi:DNA-binding phage protein